MRQDRDETMIPWILGTLAAAAVGAMIGKLSRSPLYSFRNKTVLITGGSRGLGLEIARLLAREGAYLSLIARNTSTLEVARRELDGIGHRTLMIPCDVRDQKEVERAVRQTVDSFGRLDVLFNNAGVIQVGPFDSMTMEDYQNAMETHAWGSLYSMLAAIPHMRIRGGGRIVNVVSIGGKIGVPHLLPYVMSKFAQAGLSEALGAELARDEIFVTTAYPGLMRRVPTSMPFSRETTGTNLPGFLLAEVCRWYPSIPVEPLDRSLKPAATERNPLFSPRRPASPQSRMK